MESDWEEVIIIDLVEEEFEIEAIEADERKETPDIPEEPHAINGNSNKEFNNPERPELPPEEGFTALCGICKTGFHDSESLFRHARAYQGKKSKCSSSKEVFSCGVCGKELKTKYILKNHIRIHDKTYTDDRIYNEPRRIHQNQNARSGFVCPVCGQDFIGKPHFTTHINSHTNYKPWECPTCAKDFSGIRYLRDHLKRKCGLVKDFRCQCDFICATSAEFLNHLKRNHKELNTILCPFCRQKFTMISELNKHINMIHGEQEVIDISDSESTESADEEE